VKLNLMTDDLGDLSLFREFAATRRRATRNTLVERHMGLAAHIANRFSRHGRKDDDIKQVAMIGLVKAVDRFDPEFGVAFASFAGRTIEGEIKRHYRDKGWAVKVPRSAKELHLEVRRAIGELEQLEGKSPSVVQLAAHLRIDREDVVRGLAATAASTVGTIDAPGRGDDGMASDRQAALASTDRRFEDAENAEMVQQLLEKLPERERQIVELRFFADKSQSEIAEMVGVSQMHVSRLLRRSFEAMRMSMSGPSSDD
jgi:RNA polymerase sigma-B factor